MTDSASALVGGQVLGRGGQVAGDLQAQLAGGHHDQGAGRAGERALPDAGRDAVQQRHAEGERLAHAGAGLADHVVAGERQRHGQFLDGKGAFDALFG